MASLLAGDPGDMQGMILVGLLESCTDYSCLSCVAGVCSISRQQQNGPTFLSLGEECIDIFY